MGCSLVWCFSGYFASGLVYSFSSLGRVQHLGLFPCEVAVRIQIQKSLIIIEEMSRLPIYMFDSLNPKDVFLH